MINHSFEKFDFSKDYILENDRVILSPLKDEDKVHLLGYSLNEPTLWKYSLVSASGKKNLDMYFKSALDAKSKQDSYPFLVYDKLHRDFAGSTRFYDIQLVHKTLQLGYTWYGKKFWGTGLNRNCKYLLLDLAFSQLGMERVEFRADYDNKRSIAALKSIGCHEEGVLRSNCATPGGQRRSSIVLSILKGEWESGLQINLKNKL